MGLADEIDIIAVIGGDTELKYVARTNGGEYAGACPFCGDGNDRFRVWPERASYWCRICGQAGDAINYLRDKRGFSFVDAKRELGITDTNGRNSVPDTMIEFRNLAHYASTKGVPVKVFEDYGWADVELWGRRALEYPTYAMVDGERMTYLRIRFIDGDTDGAKFMPKQSGYPAVLYGLNTALRIHSETGLPLILVNGEPSTVVGHYWNTPAFCKTGGEAQPLTPEMVDEIKSRYTHDTIMIAHDCDAQGKRFAEIHMALFTEAGYDVIVLDLELGAKGDYADACLIWEDKIVGRLQNAMSAPEIAPIHEATSAYQAASLALAVARNEVQIEGRPLPFPFKIYNHLQGACIVLPPETLALIFGMSGHGKTAWLETACEYWMQHGYNGIYDGREFRPIVYQFRRIQRMSGQPITNPMEDAVYTPELVTVTEYELHRAWQAEVRENRPTYLRFGRELSPEKIETIEWVAGVVKRWPGHMEYAPAFNYIEDLLAWMKAHIDRERTAGRKVDFVVFDYLHLYSLDTSRTRTGRKENDYMVMAHMIKDFVREYHIFGIIAAQVNKVADASQRKNNRPLTIADAKGISDQFANLTMSINILYAPKIDETTRYHLLDYNGEIVLDKATLMETGNQAGQISVIKNTMELTGLILQQARLQNLCWMDALWQREMVDLLDEGE